MSPAARKFLRIALPLAVAAVLLLWLARHIDFAASASLLRQMPPGLLAAAVLAMLVSYIFSALRFWLLARKAYSLSLPESVGLNLLTVLSAHGFGLLSDGLRVHYIMRHGASLRQGVDLTLADRLLSLWLLAICAVLLLPCALAHQPWAYGLAALALVGLLFGAWLCTLSLYPAWLKPCLQVFIGGIDTPRQLLLQVMISLLASGAIAAALLLLAVALDFTLPLNVALAFAPLSILAASVPFTYAGLGTREAAFAFLVPWLAPHIGREQALALSFGFALLMLLASLPGLLFLPKAARK